MPTPKQKMTCVRGLDAALYARVKAKAKAEGVRLRDWIERAFTNELVGRSWAKSDSRAAGAAADKTGSSHG
jgi:hypothetical protein